MSHELSNTGHIASDHSHNTPIDTDRVVGAKVFDTAGEQLGDVQSIMIDKITGKVAYVLISFGGVPGIAEKLHPLLWDMLDYDTAVDGYRIDIARADLKGAPSYDRDGDGRFDSNDSDAADRFHAGPSRAESHPPTVNRSDLNDGIERPLGFYSRKAQSLRNSDTQGSDDTDPTTGLRADEEAPGFYSPEQQAARSDINALEDQVRQPDPRLNEIDGRNDAASRWRNGETGPGFS